MPLATQLLQHALSVIVIARLLQDVFTNPHGRVGCDNQRAHGLPGDGFRLGSSEAFDVGHGVFTGVARLINIRWDYFKWPTDRAQDISPAWTPRCKDNLWQHVHSRAITDTSG